MTVHVCFFTLCKCEHETKEDKESLGDESNHLIRCNGALASESILLHTCFPTGCIGFKINLRIGKQRKGDLIEAVNCDCGSEIANVL